MKKALRIGYHRYYRDDLFREHLAYIQKHRAVIDEITLFAEFSHYGYWDLDFSAQNAALLKERIAAYRTVGIARVGINLLSTIGHLDEGWGVLPHAPFPYQVRLDGSVSKGQLCFSNEDFLKHVAARYTLYAKTGADFIWMDDDIRIEGVGCCCDGCIRAFNREEHTDLVREEMAERFAREPSLHQLWMQHQERAIQRLIATVRESIRAVDPRVALGYMSIHGNAKSAWIEESRAEMARPGGGFYDERTPCDILKKCFYVQSQISVYPDRISDIQYEYEAFNYQTLNRTRRFTELETSLALMSGCTGVLYNNDIFRDSEMLADMLTDSCGAWSVLADTNRGGIPAGIYCLGGRSAKNLAELGLPVTAHPSAAVATFATGSELAAQTDDTLQGLLDMGLLTDGEGLRLLCARGFEAACGGKILQEHPSGMAERFADHPANGIYRNAYRDAYMSFSYYYNNQGSAFELSPVKEAEILSHLEAITHRPLGCSCYLYERADGVCFAADGYLQPNSLNTLEKREQITNLLDRISHGRLPVRIDAPVKLVTSVIRRPDGGMQILLANASLDDSGEFTCTVRTNEKLLAIAPTGERYPLTQTHTPTEVCISIKNLGPWEHLLLTSEPRQP